MQTARVASSTLEKSAQPRSASAAVVRPVPVTLRPFPAPGTPGDAPNASGAPARAQCGSRSNALHGPVAGVRARPPAIEEAGPEGGVAGGRRENGRGPATPPAPGATNPGRKISACGPAPA